jgi:hypothetical protein
LTDKQARRLGIPAETAASSFVLFCLLYRDKIKTRQENGWTRNVGVSVMVIQW